MKVHLQQIRKEGDTVHIQIVEADDAHEVEEVRRVADAILYRRALLPVIEVTPVALAPAELAPTAVGSTSPHIEPEPFTAPQVPEGEAKPGKRRCSACRREKGLSAFRGNNRTCMHCVRRISRSRGDKRRARRETKTAMRRGEGMRPRKVADKLRCLIDLGDGDGELCQQIVDKAHASQHAYEHHAKRIDSTRLWEHFEDVTEDEMEATP